MDNITHKIDENIDSNVAVLAILDNQNSVYKSNITLNATYNHSQPINQEESNVHETNKQNIIWTKEATITLLSIYETRMHMLDNPKKKSKMWLSMAEDLKAYSIEVTPDQVRWKINALTKKYKDCIDNGHSSALSSFKYFNEMHQILGDTNDTSGTYRLASGIDQSNNDNKRKTIKLIKSTPFRKLRAEQRAKVELDKQWIEYLKRQEEQREIREEKLERNLWLREEELQLRKKELEIKQTIAMKKLELREKKHEEMLKIEREKCMLLKKLIENQEIMRQ